MEELKLIGNTITELPPSIRHLKSLKASSSDSLIQALNICIHHPSALPHVLLNPSALPQVLILSINGLKHLPDDLAALTALSHLDLSLNNIEYLGSACVPPRLNRLDLQVGWVDLQVGRVDLQVGRVDLQVGRVKGLI